MVCALILENIISALAQLNARSWQNISWNFETLMTENGFKSSSGKK
jgi:hypothetical protein